MGAAAASLLLDEIARGGCIDTNMQPLVFTMMALSSEDVSRLRIGQLGPAGIATLRLLKTFFGITFRLKAEVHDPEGPEAAAARADARSSRGTSAGGAGTGDDDHDDGDGNGDAAGGAGGVGGKRKFKSLYGGREAGSDVEDDAYREGGGDDAPGKRGEQPLTAATRGGHSGGGKTVLVSCLGLGFKNFAKKVT
jgi:hypothetical protein